MPVERAQYQVLLSRAVHATRYEILWEISLVEGWSLIHAGGILHGETFIWADPRLSEVGRTLLKARDLRRSRPWRRQIEAEL